jgi:CheY-like chemotaxis protein
MVLIADDDADIRETLAEVLRIRGYDVRTVSDGKGALQFLQTSRPCLVLLDLMMPGISGWQVAAKMSADGALATIPVCVITAAREEPPRGVRVLRKPLELLALLKTVREYCDAPAT